MPSDDSRLERAFRIGEEQAKTVLESRRQAREKKKPSAGVLVAEGDSWFHYPFHDVLGILEDEFGYDVESVAHWGDRIEEMAYGGGQLDDLARQIEKVIRAKRVPKAILLSGGGNDVAGEEFGMLLNHALSPVAGINDAIARGVIEERVQTAYVAILAAVTRICEANVGHAIPIVIHGYDRPVPDGRGYAGGWGPMPGPWLEPGFREKGFLQIPPRIALAGELIDRFNVMLSGIPKLAGLSHVHFLDLRGTLTTDSHYKDWWANELHPTAQGFRAVAAKFASEISSL